MDSDPSDSKASDAPSSPSLLPHEQSGFDSAHQQPHDSAVVARVLPPHEHMALTVQLAALVAEQSNLAASGAAGGSVGLFSDEPRLFPSDIPATMSLHRARLLSAFGASAGAEPSNAAPVAAAPSTRGKAPASSSSRHAPSASAAVGSNASSSFSSSAHSEWSSLAASRLLPVLASPTLDGVLAQHVQQQQQQQQHQQQLGSDPVVGKAKGGVDSKDGGKGGSSHVSHASYSSQPWSASSLSADQCCQLLNSAIEQWYVT
jgi:hypothetical protein